MIREQRGVTLIELMLVIVCLSILAAIAVPRWISSGLPAYRLKNAARQVVSDIRLARVRSVSTNRQFRLRFDPAVDTYSLEMGDSPNESFSWTAAGFPRKFGPGGAPSFFGVSISGEEEYSVIFRPTGGVTSKTITLQNTVGNTIKIVCSMAGRIRLVRE